MKNTTIITNESIKRNEHLERLVQEVYAQEAVKIGFAELPLELEYKENTGYVASCSYSIRKLGFFGAVKVDKAVKIVVNLVALEREINSMLFTKRARRKGAQYIVIHTLRHELRHAWQTVHAKHLLEGRNQMIEGINDMLFGYGQRPEEADANQYAEQYDAGKYQVLLRACTMSQDLGGKHGLTKEEMKQYRTTGKELIALNAKLILGLIK